MTIHKDLRGEASMTPIVGMLYSAVIENFNRLISLIDGLSQDEIDYKGPGQQYNSIAQLLRHLTYVDINWVFRIKQEPLPQLLENKLGPIVDEQQTSSN